MRYFSNHPLGSNPAWAINIVGQLLSVTARSRESGKTMRLELLKRSRTTITMTRVTLHTYRWIVKPIRLRGGEGRHCTRQQVRVSCVSHRRKQNKIARFSVHSLHTRDACIKDSRCDNRAGSVTSETACHASLCLKMTSQSVGKRRCHHTCL